MADILSIDSSPLTLDALTEANHRFANHLAMLTSLVRMQSDRLARSQRAISSAEAAQSLAAVGAKIEAIAKLHKLLAHPSNRGAIDFGPYIKDIVSGVVESFSRPDATDLSLALDVTCHLDHGRALNVALIICEVVTNSMKYAHPSGIGGRLAVRCRRSPTHLVIEVEDDGVGLPPHLEPESAGNTGFRVIRSLADQLDATMKFHSDELGLTFRLEVPMAELRIQPEHQPDAESRQAVGGV